MSKFRPNPFFYDDDPYYNDLSNLKNEHIDKQEIERICEYLKNPIKKGVWFLTYKWIYEDGISAFIESEIEKSISNENIQNIRIINRKDRSTLKIIKTFLGNKEDFLELTNSISFIFSLFTYMYLKEKDEKISQIDLKDLIDGVNLSIIQVLDIKKVKNEYMEAYEIFKNEIYYDNFDPNIAEPIIDEENFFKIKDGIILLNSNYHNSLISLSYYDQDNCEEAVKKYSPLDKVRDFFEKIGKIEDIKTMPEYSPDDVVFIPYFTFLEIVLPYIIRESKVTDLFKNAINEYNNANYQYCIINLGLIAEDCLSQIYITFFREYPPNRSALGDTYNLINSKINNEFPSKIISAPDINPLFVEVKNLLSNESDADEIKLSHDTLELIRRMLHFLQMDKKHTTFLLNNINQKEYHRSLFPKNIKEAIKELIELRNAASHKSLVPFIKSDAQRMVYYCITLIMWWKDEKNIIEWEEPDPKIIVQKTIDRNNSSQST